MNEDATQPRRADVIPNDVNLEDYQQQSYDENDSSGPGCIAWGIVGMFGIVFAIAIVVTAALAGVNQGLGTVQITSVAATNQAIGQNCSILPTDIAANRYEVVESRYEALTVDGVVAPCAQTFVEQATAIYAQSLITPTSLPTEIPTSVPTATNIPAESTVEIVATSDSPYDLPALLTEARDFMALSDFDEAISTLDAIRAIDATFETQVVNNMLFTALTQQALVEFRTPTGSLAEGILLTNRAEQFGNIQLTELAFERSVAEYYLDALANVGLNYQLAISNLNLLLALAPNYPRGTGEASSLLLEQYEGYGDALLLGGDACLAESQFINAQALSPNNVAIQGKIETANQQCQFGAPATLDPNATVDPNATTVPAENPTSGVAPVGQSG